MSKFKPSLVNIRRMFSKLRIIVNSDDGEEDYDTTFYPNGYGSNQISMGNDNTGSNDAGFRFLRPLLPNNVKITSAKLRVKSAVNSTKRPNLIIKGIKQTSTLSFDATHRPSQQPKTTATVAWIPGADWVQNTWYESPDIKAIIQEIIDQTEFTNKAIGLVIEDNSSPANNYENIYDFNSGAANAAQLILTLEPDL
ncbi:MAG: hypothetical protein PHQ59_01835 [Candidatus Daviesbacteria bacterium]|nr:hypothetical protein [Candidatus Daviesbacteria bacterium]